MQTFLARCHFEDLFDLRRDEREVPERVAPSQIGLGVDVDHDALAFEEIGERVHDAPPGLLIGGTR